MYGTSVVTVVTAFTLGALSGWLTGQSGPEPTVTAAVLPAIFTLSGALVFTKNLHSDKNPHSDDRGHGVQVILFIVVFCASFYSALGNGVKKRNEDLTTSARETYETHMRHLRTCRLTEKVVNSYRVDDGLLPLSPEYFCRKAP